MSGIAFKIGDEFLKLPENQKISISLENQLFTNNVIAGAISLPFSVDNTPHNRKLLNLSNTLQSFGDTEIVTGVACFLGGNLWRKGKMIINGQVTKTINLSFVEFDKEEDFQNKKINSFDYPVINYGSFGTDQFIQDIENRAKGIFPNNEKDFVCPTTFNSNLFDDPNNVLITMPSGTTENQIQEQNKTIFQNYYDSNGYSLKDALNDYPIFGTGGIYQGNRYGQRNFISPYFYINYILKYLFANFGLNIDYNFLSTEDLDDLIMYTNKYIMTRSALKQDDTVNTAFVNASELDYKLYIPEIEILDFLSSLKNGFNLIYFFNYNNSSARIMNKSEVLKSAKSIDITKHSSVYVDLKYDSKELKKINRIRYAQVDDAIITNFSLDNFTYKGSVNSVADLPITSDISDYYKVKIFGSIFYVNDAYNFYYWNGSGWQILDLNEIKTITPYSIYIDEHKKTEELNLKLDTLVTRNNDFNYYIDTSLNYSTYYTPAIDYLPQWIKYSTYNFSLVNPIIELTSLHLLFYRGMAKELKHGFDFPYAGRTNFFPARILSPTLRYEYTDSYEWSLDIDGPKGLYEKCYKNWIDFTKQVMRIVAYTVRWKASDITDDLFYNYLQIDSKKFILQKLTINATPTQILPCKAEMYQLEPK